VFNYWLNRSCAIVAVFFATLGISVAFAGGFVRARCVFYDGQGAQATSRRRQSVINAMDSDVTNAMFERVVHPVLHPTIDATYRSKK